MRQGIHTGWYIINNMDEQYTIEIEYTYKVYDSQFKEEIDEDIQIEQVLINGVDLTGFYYDYLDKDIIDELYDYARDSHSEIE
jgi:hypothetical protein|tara:strand:+ start:12180 stop:12428 length:249 start_codon:yes stop_codon:yes gene_type:complete